MKKIIVFFSSTLFLIACTNNEQPKQMNKKDSTAMQSEVPQTIDVRFVDNKKDPSCGMPVTAGISDTAHYNNKVFGFCSKECKDNFLKKPEELVAAAELKK
ncbi:MAG: YHS domain-containing protein [Bacteroidetes bacterium]|nr:YHS domain-containing protein [Bacteroidota bacterium]MBS1648259.1 YHS domain-containing protein [Bacteroidota bacterium]